MSDRRERLARDLARKIHGCDEQMEKLRRERYDCVKAWEKATGRRWMPGPPTPPDSAYERGVA